jgi:hypothetical protein
MQAQHCCRLMDIRRLQEAPVEGARCMQAQQGVQEDRRHQGTTHAGALVQRFLRVTQTFGDAWGGCKGMQASLQR